MENKIKFRLPSREEFENLIKHPHSWNDKKRTIEIFADNGDTLVFPAKGYRECHRGFENVGFCGHYWSSTEHKWANYAIYAYVFEFSDEYCRVFSECRHDFRSVRLVSDTPFDGSIEIDGLYWKTENEEDRFGHDYCTYNDAMETFDNYITNKIYIVVE